MRSDEIDWLTTKDGMEWFSDGRGRYDEAVAKKLVLGFHYQEA